MGLYDIKNYMASSVMQLTLQRLDLLRYSPPQGQSQSQTTQTVVELFRNCDGFNIKPEEVLIICLLNTIQEKSVLIKVQEAIDVTTSWEAVKNMIVKIDSTSRISDEFKQRKLKFTGATTGVKACRACGKKGHMASSCTVPKAQLKCKYCETEKSHNTAACLKKKKNDKKKEEEKGSKSDQTAKKPNSQERRDGSDPSKRNLSQTKSNRSPQRFGAPCAQVRVYEKGDSPPDNDSDSDEEYDTPPESLESDINPEENDDPNVPENTDDEISVDEDSEIFHNTAGNDSAIETANLRNFPDLLRIQNSNQETTPDEETAPPSKCTGARPKERLPIDHYQRRNHPPLRDVVLPQLQQTPCPIGVCVPPYEEPTEPWCGFGSEKGLMDFLSKVIPSDDEDSVTNTTKQDDPIEDMGKYVQTILTSDEEDEKECKKEHNIALAMYTKVQMLHDENKQENIEKVWDLSKEEETNSALEELCEKLEKIIIDETEENSDSSTNTVLEKVKHSEDEEKVKTDAASTPIPGESEYSIVHSPGMESKNQLDTAKTKKNENRISSSRIYDYGSQIVHEEECDCPYCYVRRSSKKRMTFSLNAASMMKIPRNTKCSPSRPTACLADISAIPTPMINLKMKAHKDGENYMATIRALPDTGASIDCVEESYARKHNLEIRPDTSGMIKLINAEGKAMKVVGTTKLLLRIRGGTWVTTVALVCPRLSHQMLLSWQTQKKLQILHEGWPFSTIESANTAYNPDYNTTPKRLRPKIITPDPQIPQWPKPEWPKELQDICVEWVRWSKLEK